MLTKIDTSLLFAAVGDFSGSTSGCDLYLDYLKNIIKLDTKEMQPILEGSGNMLVIACAGSGKSTNLVHKYLYDFQRGDFTDNRKAWVCTFLKKGADDLKAKINTTYLDFVTKKKPVRRITTPTTEWPISTMHSEFFRAYRHMTHITPNIISENANLRILQDILDLEGIHYDNRSEKNNIVDDFAAALSYTRNYPENDNRRYKHVLYDSLNIQSTTVDRILRKWKFFRQKEGFMDFDDVQEVIYEKCVVERDKNWIEYISNCYTSLYIDEFQDTSQVQYEILKVYASKSPNVLAIGDDDQTIYTWRGSNNNIILHSFEEDFHAKQYYLSYNFRCKENILNPVVPSIEKNKGRHSKTIKAFYKGGNVEKVLADSYYNMSDKCLAQIEKDQLEYKGEHITVLTRTNEDAMLLVLRMAEKNLDFSASGKILSGRESRLKKQCETLFGFVLYGRRAHVRNLCKMALPYNKAVEGLLDYMNGEDVSKTFWDYDPDTLNIPDKDLSELLIKPLRYKKEHSDEEDCDIHIMANLVNMFVTKYFGSRENAQYNSYSEMQKAIMNALWNYIVNSPYADLEMIYDNWREILTRAASHTGRDDSDKTPIEIATVHDYKGAQSSLVYIWNDSEGMFPHFKKGERITADTKEEERRIHYIACTRAQNKLVIFTIRQHEGEFLKELNLSTPSRTRTTRVF